MEKQKIGITKGLVPIEDIKHFAYALLWSDPQQAIKFTREILCSEKSSFFEKKLCGYIISELYNDYAPMANKPVVFHSWGLGQGVSISTQELADALATRSIKHGENSQVNIIDSSCNLSTPSSYLPRYFQLIYMIYNKYESQRIWEQEKYLFPIYVEPINDFSQKIKM